MLPQRPRDHWPVRRVRHCRQLRPARYFYSQQPVHRVSRVSVRLHPFLRLHPEPETVVAQDGHLAGYRCVHCHVLGQGGI